MKEEFNFQWHITNLCNLRCRHCYQDDFSKDLDLEFGDIKSVVDNIIFSLREKNMTTRIDLTGGEPFLKKELFDLLDYLNRQNTVKQLNIITSAILINKEILKKLKAYSKLRYIKVSLESLKEDFCDWIRGEGVFKKVISSLELLKKYDFKVILMFTLLKKNIEEIPHILDFCYEYKLDGIILERFIPLGKGKDIQDQVLDKNSWKKTLELLLSISPSDYNLSDFLPYRAFWIDLKRSFFTGKFKIKLLGAKCNIGETLCIMPNADIFVCRRFNLVLGNLLRDSLKDIWKNPLLRELRDKKLFKGKCRDCKENCIGCRAIAFCLTGDYFSEDAQCWY